MPSANTEELRRKFQVVQQHRSAPPMLTMPLGAAVVGAGSGSGTVVGVSNTAGNNNMQAVNNMSQGVSGVEEPERTYVFPSTVVGGATFITNTQNTQIPAFLDSFSSVGKGHARSMSHGGVAGMAGGRPIKSAMKGHQRAFSQGQITDSPSAVGHSRGHSRMGSKTDFILPPGHKDENEVVREFGPSAPTSGSGRGHSRQASRSDSIYTLRRTETPPWWRRIGVCQSDNIEDRASYRTVVPNHTVPPKTPKCDHPNGLFVGNKIRTTKYTLLSFIPKNLLEQFHRVANLYFIFIVLLNWFPAINAFGKEVAMIPVLFVLGVTAVKDLFEDRRRRCSDKRINNTTCRVYDRLVTLNINQIQN